MGTVSATFPDRAPPLYLSSRRPEQRTRPPTGRGPPAPGNPPMLEEIVATPTPLYPPHQTPHHISKRAVTGWVLYDLANTIFSMGVVSVYFSLWVHDQVGARRADTVYGLITAASMGLIFLF